MKVTFFFTPTNVGFNILILDMCILTRPDITQSHLQRPENPRTYQPIWLQDTEFLDGLWHFWVEQRWLDCCGQAEWEDRSQRPSSHLLDTGSTRFIASNMVSLDHDFQRIFLNYL